MIGISIRITPEIMYFFGSVFLFCTLQFLNFAAIAATLQYVLIINELRVAAIWQSGSKM